MNRPTTFAMLVCCGLQFASPGERLARAQSAPPTAQPQPQPRANPAPGRARAPFKRPDVDPHPDRPWAAPLAATERRITILGTNDIHGGLEPVVSPKGQRQGGMALWSGVVRAIRQGLTKREPGRGGVLVVDAGDQFQGTLISNVSEGQALITAMTMVGRTGPQGGYDAIVPGNHDYDFGPADWKIDEAQTDAQRREALSKVIQILTANKTPLLSANTFERDSIVYPGGVQKKAGGKLCQPALADGAAAAPTPLVIDYQKARRPSFLKPYVLKTVAGVKVALIGMDNPSTPETTTARNVDDLCFADAFESYRALQPELLKQQVNVYVLVIHDGNSNNEKALSATLKSIKGAGLRLDAVVSGHTHFTYADEIEGIPVIQSGAGGKAFGRIDLVWDTAKKQVVADKTKLAGGIQLLYEGCDPEFAKGFCSFQDGKLLYEGQAAVADPQVEAHVRKAREAIVAREPLAEKKLGTVAAVLRPNRIEESPLTNALTDEFRKLAHADIAMVNTGGIRAPIAPHKPDKSLAATGSGDFYFEDLFAVLPFNNHGVIVEVSGEVLEELLRASIKSCGRYGTLLASGLMVEFTRDCTDKGVDESAQLVRVKKLDGTVLFDAEKKLRPPADARFTIATFDFLAKGGSGYRAFTKGRVVQDLGILRDRLAEHLVSAPATWSDQLDGRWKWLNKPANDRRSEGSSGSAE